MKNKHIQNNSLTLFVFFIGFTRVKKLFPQWCWVSISTLWKSSSWYWCTTTLPRLSNRNIISLWMALQHSGPTAGFSSDIFPPLIDYFRPWGFRAGQEHFLTWCPELDVPSYSASPEEATLVGELFFLKFRVSSWKQQKASITKGGSLRGLSRTLEKRASINTTFSLNYFAVVFSASPKTPQRCFTLQVGRAVQKGSNLTCTHSEPLGLNYKCSSCVHVQFCHLRFTLCKWCKVQLHLQVL